MRQLASATHDDCRLILQMRPSRYRLRVQKQNCLLMPETYALNSSNAAISRHTLSKRKDMAAFQFPEEKFHKNALHIHFLHKKTGMTPVDRSMGGEGFEPSKLSQQIYSLPPLAARESTHIFFCRKYAPALIKKRRSPKTLKIE